VKFRAKPLSPSQLKTDLLGLAVLGGKIASPFGREIDRRLGGLLSKLIRKEDFKGKSGDSRLVDTHGKIGAATILLIGLGEEAKLEPDVLRKTAAWLVRTGNKIRAAKVTLEDFPSLPGLKKIPAERRAQLFAEGTILRNYSFDLYKSNNNDKKSIQEFEILTADRSAAERGLKKGVLFAEATNYARDLINIPASDMTPRRMAEEARKIGRLPRLSVKIYDKREIEKMGMGCYLAVARGSTEPPYFIHLRYRPPSRPKKSIAVIGKGVTFDSGGLSLKTAQSMETMKDDMSGAAAMLAVMKALSTLRPSVEVHGIAAVTENMPSGSADKPGDIVRTMNGKTVEILNTDAEGRLTLADAMTYALKQKPDLVIDVATLTGACVIALGELCSGILGNNQNLIDRLIECGKSAGEKIWQLPLVEEYKEELKSSAADLKNIGGRWGGTINGALFIQEFVDSKVPWAHIDIAGPSWTEKELDYSPRGGTGHIVRTLLTFILEN
jgi:leucyl aminopeptidase